MALENGVKTVFQGYFFTMPGARFYPGHHPKSEFSLCSAMRNFAMPMENGNSISPDSGGTCRCAACGANGFHDRPRRENQPAINHSGNS